MATQRHNDTENRRKEERVAAAFPVKYSFYHNVERRDTKSLRAGTTLDVSRFGVSFVAQVVDPSILPSALRGEIIMAVTITTPLKTYNTTCRLAWVTPLTGQADRFLVGAEYTDADDAEREEIFAAAKASGGKKA